MRVIGSSSSGNAYVLETPTEVLLLECGVPMQRILRALRFDLSKVVGCVISHRHNDHSKALPDLLRKGIRCFAPEDVFADNICTRYVSFCKVVYPMHGYKVGNFKVFAFDLRHADSDGTPCPCFGYIIEHTAMGKLLFVTDTMMMKYRFTGLSHIMIEANYEDGILEQNIEDGLTAAAQKPRLLASHLEVHQTAKILRQTDLTGVNNIILLHLSSGNSDKRRFEEIIGRAVGQTPYIAEPNFRLELTAQPY